MQQVARSLRQKNKRDRLRNKIQQLTPQQYFNNIRYHNPSLSPHQILSHQYQHLNRYAYNKNQVITNRNLYSLSEALIYEPLRRNQLRAQEEVSKNLMHGNQFLKSFDPKQYKARKEDYFERVQAVQNEKKLEQQKKVRQIPRVKSVILPPIKPKKSYRFLKLRAIGIAVYFMCMVRNRRLDFIDMRREYCFKNHKTLLQQGVKTMKSYYYNKLEKEITLYIILLQKKSKYPNYSIKKDAINILTSFSQKLNKLPVPITIIAILKIVCSNYSFFPLPYLFKQEIARLQFLQDQPCIINMNTDRSCMMASCLMVIKLLCFNLFYRPWLTEDLFKKKNQKCFNIAAKYDVLQKSINRIGSIFYFIAIDNFIHSNPIVKRSNRQFQNLIRQNQLKLVPFLSIAPNEKIAEKIQYDSSSEEQQNQQLTKAEQQSLTEINKNHNLQDETNLIVGQNRRFYQKMKIVYKDEMQEIQKNITDWVTKITLSALAQFQKQRRLRVNKLYSQQ